MAVPHCSTACCSLTDLCDAVPKLPIFFVLSQSADPEARCRQRVVQESHARASWRLLIDKQSRQAVPPRAAPAHGGRRSLEELSRGEAGV